MKASQLQFNKVEGSPPAFTCNVCSGHTTNSVWRVADIPIHEGKDVASIVVCSKRCQKMFVQHPAAKEYIADLVKRTEAMKRPEPTAQELARIKDMVTRAAAQAGIEVSDIKFNL